MASPPYVSRPQGGSQCSCLSGIGRNRLRHQGNQLLGGEWAVKTAPCPGGTQSRLSASGSTRCRGTTTARELRTHYKSARIASRETRLCRAIAWRKELSLPTLCTAIFGTSGQRGASQRGREESSCDRQDLVANKVEANSIRPRPIKKERGGRLEHVPPQLVPRIPFGEDAFRQAFGGVAAIGLLDDLEHQFRHTSIIRQGSSVARRSPRSPTGDPGLIREWDCDSRENG